MSNSKQMRGMALMAACVFMAACLAVLAPVRALAVGSIIVSDAWTRALLVQDGTAVVYVTITDLSTPDQLVGVSSPIAQGADLREAEIVDGSVRAHPIRSIAVTADQPTELAPGSRQVILLTGMQTRLEEGKHFPLTLTFQKAGPVETTVQIRAADYSDPVRDDQ